MPRPNKKIELFSTVREKHEAGATLVEIGQELGISPVTLGRWFREEGVKVIQRGRKKEPKKWVEHTCDQCSKPFSIQQSQKRRFCSRECTNAWQRENAAAHVRRCEGCGGPIKLQPGAKYKYTYRKFCSDECRKKHGSKRQKDPAKWETHTCLNCGETFEQRKSNQSYGKYCSGACAYRHTRTKKHIVVDDAVVLDSKWEALFWGLMGLHKIPCERYPRTGAVEWSKGCWYAPDFLLSKSNIAIEVKGVEDPQDLLRWEAYRSQRGTLAVLTYDSLDHLRRMGRDEVLNYLHATTVGDSQFA